MARACQALSKASFNAVQPRIKGSWAQSLALDGGGKPKRRAESNLFTKPMNSFCRGQRSLRQGKPRHLGGQRRERTITHIY